MKWEKVKLGNVTDSCLGKMLDQNKNKGDYQPYLANVNVRWGEFDLEDLPLMKFEESEQERYELKYGDLVICEGGEPGRCAIWKEQIPNMKIQKALHRVRVHDCLDYRYLFYWFLLAGKTGELDQYFTGATIKHMPGQKLKEVVIDKPPLEIQHRIADILSAYDDLIENNQKQIKLLKEAAQRLYKEWFVDLHFPGHENTKIVDGVPEGWRRGLLKELISVNYGKDHKKVPDDGNIPVYGSGGLMRKCNKSLFSGEAVLIPRKGSLNNIMYVDETFWTVDTMFYATMKQPHTAVFVYFFVKAFDMYSMNIGAAVPSMTTKILDAMDVVIPDKETLEKFDKYAKVYFNKIKTLQGQNEQLKTARDLLLPKLMSGEVEV
ncbi:restriction endonuclease subunit S [Faecalibacterium duncaniae]|jgi:type I restriction enzyme S subunit